MHRYRIRSRQTRADFYYDDVPIRHDVIVCDHEDTFTGLLDANGDEIWREPRSIGFHHPADGSEW